MRVLITGGAGFMGSHLADHLLEHGYDVRVLDALLPEVHPLPDIRPSHVHRDVELIRGDVRDPAAMQRALTGVDAVFHFAARVGAGQSMCDIAAYTATNSLGTAVLLEQLAERPVQRLIVASTMRIYGEGLYTRADGRCIQDVARTADQLRRGDWKPRDEHGEALIPLPTPEWKQPQPGSVYALSKFEQERLTLLVAQTYRMPAVALRFFNVYGTRQTLSNPYSSVLPLFASRLQNGCAPLLFEDGHQQRDFVHVRDAVHACRLALEQPAARVEGQIFNVGGGRGWRIADVAEKLAAAIGAGIEPTRTGRYRPGDVRHCVADLTLARRDLGYEPRVRLDEGLVELAGWLSDHARRPRALVMHAGQSRPRPGVTV
jgi:dTDP-L-rhamnose 4-epimerase